MQDAVQRAVPPQQSRHRATQPRRGTVGEDTGRQIDVIFGEEVGEDQIAVREQLRPGVGQAFALEADFLGVVVPVPEARRRVVVAPPERVVFRVRVRVGARPWSAFPPEFQNSSARSCSLSCQK